MQSDEPAMDVLGQRIRLQIAARRGDSGGIVVRGGMRLNHTGQRIEHSPLPGTAFALHPRLILGTIGECEPFHQGTARQLHGLFRCGSPRRAAGRRRQPRKLDGVRPHPLRVQAQAIVFVDEGSGVRQGAAEQGEEATEVASRRRLAHVRPKQKAQMATRGRPEIDGQPIEQGARLAAGQGDRASAPRNFRRA